MFVDSDPCGLFATIAIEQNVAKVKCLMKEDPQITENETRDNFNLSLGSLNQILHHHLDVWKRCAHWVPQQLTKEQRRVGSGAFIIICLNFFLQRQVRVGLGYRHG